jgi:hypothetical protein
MLRAVADAVAVRAQVSGRQRDMLHGGEFHRFTPNRLIVGIRYDIFRTFESSFMLGGWYKQEERDL